MWIPQGCVLASFVLMAVMMLMRLAIWLGRPAEAGAEE